MRDLLEVQLHVLGQSTTTGDGTPQYYRKHSMYQGDLCENVDVLLSTVRFNGTCLKYSCIFWSRAQLLGMGHHGIILRGLM